MLRSTSIREASGGIWFTETELNGVLELDISRFRASVVAMAQREKTTITLVDSDY